MGNSDQYIKSRLFVNANGQNTDFDIGCLPGEPGQYVVYQNTVVKHDDETKELIEVPAFGPFDSAEEARAVVRDLDMIFAVGDLVAQHKRGEAAYSETRNAIVTEVMKFLGTGEKLAPHPNPL